MMHTYPCGLGRSPEGHKQVEGDGNTPVGGEIMIHGCGGSSDWTLDPYPCPCII